MWVIGLLPAHAVVATDVSGWANLVSPQLPQHKANPRFANKLLQLASSAAILVTGHVIALADVGGDAKRQVDHVRQQLPTTPGCQEVGPRGLPASCNLSGGEPMK